MLHPKDFIHPEDEAALRNMEAIPGFAAAVKAFLKLGYERILYGTNMASCIKLSSKQLPDIYNRLPPICNKLSIKEPEFFLEMNPIPNAYTFGDTNIFVVLTSGLLEYLDDDEINSVIAHECGHIACHHVLYHTMASVLADGAINVIGNILAPIKYALLYWQRKSELSCDRAAALVAGVDSVVQTQIRLAGGPKSITGKVNVNEWVKQADLYEDIRGGGLWDKALQAYAVMEQNHPFAAVRVKEILNWSKTEQYRRIVMALESGSSAKTCPSCHNTVSDDWTYCNYCGTKLK